MPRVWNKHTESPPADAVYVGRPSPIGNPFIIGRDGSREDVIRKYGAWIMKPEQDALRDAIRNQLAGRDLVCFCAPKPCHADIIFMLANPEGITHDQQ